MTQMRVGGEDLWWIDYMMHVGEGESEGLRFSGLRERILHVLGEHQDVMSHPALNEHKTQESTREELDEERQAIKALQGHHYHEDASKQSNDQWFEATQQPRPLSLRLVLLFSSSLFLSLLPLLSFFVSFRASSREVRDKQDSGSAQ